MEGWAWRPAHIGTSGARPKEVPAALLEEVFALNEELDEVRELRAGGAPADEWRPRLQQAGRPIEPKRREHEHEAAVSRRLPP